MSFEGGRDEPREDAEPRCGGPWPVLLKSKRGRGWGYPARWGPIRSMSQPQVVIYPPPAPRHSSLAGPPSSPKRLSGRTGGDFESRFLNPHVRLPFVSSGEGQMRGSGSPCEGVDQEICGFPLRLSHEAFPRGFLTGLSLVPPWCELILSVKVEAVQGKQVPLNWTDAGSQYEDSRP